MDKRKMELGVLLAWCALTTVAGADSTSLDAGGQPAAGRETARTQEARQGAKPASPFVIRGTLPWHNFLSGPTAWNEDDYRAYLDDMAARGLNLVAFHCYTGGAERYAPYVEPMVRIQYRGVVPEAGFDTSLTARWGYRPLAVKEFAFGTDKLFLLPRGAKAFGAACAILPQSNEERYLKAHDLMRKVLTMAHARGIQMAMGFEFGVHPPELASIVPPESRIGGAMLPDPTHPANIEILHSALDDIVRSYPGIDFVWLWLHEHSMFIAQPQLAGRFGEFYQREKVSFADASNEHAAFTGVWSLAYIRQAHDYLAKRSPKTRLVIGGWGGGPQLPPVLRGLDRTLPMDIVFSCLNPGMGSSGHVPVLTQIARHRPVWSIPWLEGDGGLWHLQMRASSVNEQVKAAAEAKLDGVLAIHWRTEEVRANMEAFALAAADPLQAPSGEEAYQRHCRERYGPESVAVLAPVLWRWERELSNLSSPEFFPYEPGFGRMPGALAEKARADVHLLDQIRDRTPSRQHRANLDWLADNLRFALLLDEVGRKIEPAYRLKERQILGEVTGPELAQQAATARRELLQAPIKELFDTFARRVRSPGEHGELSALNQKLWLEYRELEQFVARAMSGVER